MLKGNKGWVCKDHILHMDEEHFGKTFQPGVRQDGYTEYTLFYVDRSGILSGIKPRYGGYLQQG
jgi:hypothetical protein